MDMSNYTTVAPIMVICYLLGLFLKAIPNYRDKLIPVTIGFFGGILGILGYFLMSGFPANDVISGFSVGIVSGLASTGINQVYKQALKGDDDNWR